MLLLQSNYMHQESVRIPVGHREGAPIELEGIVLQPEGPAKGTILMSHGLSSYLSSIQPIGEFYANRFNVALIGLRGHGTSEGVFDAKKIGADFADATTYVQNEFSNTPLFYSGFSMGATAAMMNADKAQALALFSPYLGWEHLHGQEPAFQTPIKSWVDMCNIATQPRTRELWDKTLRLGTSDRIFKNFFNALNHPWQGFASVKELSEKDIPISETPALHFIAGQDELLQLHTPYDQRQYAAAVQQKLPNSRFEMRLTRPLNHVLNTKPFDYGAVLKPEAGKPSEEILDKAAAFLEQYSA
jgi:pimeloyl-ACP methyl ester carboxylesterase